MVGCGGGGGQASESGSISEQQLVQSDNSAAIAADNDSTIHLSWDYLVERMDGFRIYQLDANGNFGAMHIIEGLETEYDVTGLDDGEYHFAVTVVDSDEMESDFSDVVTVTVI